MRIALAPLALAVALATSAPASMRARTISDQSATPAKAFAVSTWVSPVIAMQDLQIQDKKLDVDINVNRGGGGDYRWYRSPVWIAIGAIAGVVILLLLVMAVRGGGGGTTIVKE